MRNPYKRSAATLLPPAHYYRGFTSTSRPAGISRCVEDACDFPAQRSSAPRCLYKEDEMKADRMRHSAATAETFENPPRIRKRVAVANVSTRLGHPFAMLSLHASAPVQPLQRRLLDFEKKMGARLGRRPHCHCVVMFRSAYGLANLDGALSWEGEGLCTSRPRIWRASISNFEDSKWLPLAFAFLVKI